MSKPPRIGVCIYCGSTQKPLKTEHIIPFGWNIAGGEGDVLLEASCGDCEDVTKSFEQYVLRELFGNIRKVLGLRSRTSTFDKQVEQLVRDKDGKEKTLAIPVNELTDVMYLPVFSVPGICRNISSIKDCELDAIQLINIGEKTNKNSYVTNNIDEVSTRIVFKNKSFEKFILKIAYCTAVKNFGYNSVKNSPISKLLLGYDKRFGTFLGCLEHSFLPKATHKGTWMQYGSYEVPNGIISAVKLFAIVDESPEYHVVIKQNST